jgi:hypothetical protein
VVAANLRRPVGDALGHAHVGIVFMHPYSSYQNFSMCNGLARGRCGSSPRCGRPRARSTAARRARSTRASS